jgi:hypothetical protein
MTDTILLVTALVIVGLGIRLAMKFREMASWKNDDAVMDARKSRGIPSDLRELNIEDPSDDGLNRQDAPEQSGSPETR